MFCFMTFSQMCGVNDILTRTSAFIRWNKYRPLSVPGPKRDVNRDGGIDFAPSLLVTLQIRSPVPERSGVEQTPITESPDVSVSNLGIGLSLPLWIALPLIIAGG